MSEVLPDQVIEFLQAMLPERSELLKRIEEECRRDHIPLVSLEVGQFLQVLLRIKGAQRVLELGTGIGYSTIILTQPNAQKDRHITTVEIDENRYRRACGNFAEAGVAKYITPVLGDANEVIPDLAGTFDFIFVDAAKGQYPGFFNKVWTLLEPGGIIVCDNIFLHGWVIDMTWPERRKKTMVCRVRAFLETLRDHPQLVTTLLPLGDGLSVSVKEFVKDEKGGAVSPRGKP